MHYCLICCLYIYIYVYMEIRKKELKWRKIGLNIRQNGPRAQIRTTVRGSGPKKLSPLADIASWKRITANGRYSQRNYHRPPSEAWRKIYHSRMNEAEGDWRLRLKPVVEQEYPILNRLQSRDEECVCPFADGDQGEKACSCLARTRMTMVKATTVYGWDQKHMANIS